MNNSKFKQFFLNYIEIFSTILILLILIGAYYFSDFVSSNPRDPFLILLSFTFGFLGFLTFIFFKLNNVIMFFYKFYVKSKIPNDNYGIIHEKDRVEFYKKTSNFRKYSYWKQSYVIPITFMVLYPISKFLNHSYTLLIILLILLIYDYFLRRFSLNWARQMKYKRSHIYGKEYWDETNWEEFYAPFLQLVLVPLIIFNILYFDITLYSWDGILVYPILFTFSFISLFSLLITLLPLILFIMPQKNKSRLESVYEFYNAFLPDYSM